MNHLKDGKRTAVEESMKNVLFKKEPFANGIFTGRVLYGFVLPATGAKW